ncbi:hypothetical protein PRVXH_000932 [Proteinivorax hydrogeniformans]|uniref:Uncharacterized protein n=1 Tax=Proteinivorax hydrogeniformans TaxID=1826727 RepID=A0AAU8HW31_9FIRM
MKVLTVFLMIIMGFSVFAAGCSQNNVETFEEEALELKEGTEKEQQEDNEEIIKQEEEVEEVVDQDKEAEEVVAQDNNQFDIVEVLKEVYAPLDYFYNNLDNDCTKSSYGVGLPKKYNTRKKLLEFFQTTMSYDVAVAWVDYLVQYDQQNDVYYISPSGRWATIHDYIPQITILEKTDTRIIVEEYYDDDFEPYTTITHIEIRPDNTYIWIMDYE